PIRCLANTLTAVSRLAVGSMEMISPLLAERMVLTVMGRLPGNGPTHLARGTNKVPAPNFGKILRRSRRRAHPASILPKFENSKRRPCGQKIKTGGKAGELSHPGVASPRVVRYRHEDFA